MTVFRLPERLTFRVLDNFGVIRLHDGNAGVRSAEVDTDNAVIQDRKSVRLVCQDGWDEKPQVQRNPDS